MTGSARPEDARPGDEVAERRRAWLHDARLYLVLDARPHDRDPEEVLRPALQGGVDVVQLREKSGDERAIVRAARVFRRLCDAYDALLIVNDRPDLAIACAADGVHLGQDDGDAAAARALVGDDLLIGRSTHSAEQIEDASETPDGATGKVRGADYIAVGPVYATPTKPDYAPVGTELVEYAARRAQVPFFAIGGIDPGNLARVVAAGAERVAVVRAVRDAADPAEAARALRVRIEAGRGARAR